MMHDREGWLKFSSSWRLFSRGPSEDHDVERAFTSSVTSDCNDAKNLRRFRNVLTTDKTYVCKMKEGGLIFQFDNNIITQATTFSRITTRPDANANAC